MIVDCAIYQDGRREEVEGDLSDALDRARAASGDAFMWIGLFQPTQEEFGLVTEELKLHPLAVEDAVHAHQRPKAERYGDMVFVVLKSLRYLDGTSDIETGEIMLFIGANFVITVRHGEGNPLTGARRRLEADPKVQKAGPASVLYTVCDVVVDAYVKIADEVQTDITELEQRVFRPGTPNLVENIYSLKREVLEFRNAVDPLVPVLQQFSALGVHLLLPEAIHAYFRDVTDHAIRVSGQVASYNELLTSVLSAHLTQVSLRQNEDMRRISAWGAIIAVPTMVAGIYGMNFDHMPELHWIVGYPLAVAVMVVSCVLLYRAFRRSGWL
ncbi:MAG: magnesium/cobalt transporter CorA [Streptosporangiales bacterium]|nr:magnesium/cobalt transporter CorA [Streptosporangiales bacterium]